MQIASFEGSKLAAECNKRRSGSSVWIVTLAGHLKDYVSKLCLQNNVKRPYGGFLSA